MRPRLKLIGLTMATLVLALAASSLPMSHTLLPVFAQTSQPGKVEADRLLKEGDAQLNTGKADAAMPLLKQALKLYQESNDRAGVGQALKSIGAVYLHLKRYVKALSAFQESLTIARELKDSDLEAKVLINIGLAYQDSGKPEQALQFFQQSLAIAQKSHNQLVEQIALRNLAITYNALKQPETAIQTAQQALTVYKSLGDKPSQLNTLRLLVEIQNVIVIDLFSKGDTLQLPKAVDRAIEYAQEGINLAKELNQSPTQSFLLAQIGVNYNMVRDYPNSLKFSEQALAAAKVTGDKPGQLKAFFGLIATRTAIATQTFLEKKDYRRSLREAEKIFAITQEALQLAQELNSIETRENIIQAQVQTYNLIGHSYAKLGEIDKALNMLQIGLDLTNKFQLLYAESRILTGFDTIYTSLGRYQQKLEVEQRQLAIARQLNDPLAETSALGTLATTYIVFGDNPTAIAFSKQTLKRSEAIDLTKLNTFERATALQAKSFALNTLHDAYYALGNYSQALDFAQQRLVIIHNIPDPEQEVDTLVKIGHLYTLREELPSALLSSQQAWEIALKLNQPSSEVSALLSLSNVYQLQGNIPKALELIQQAVKIAQQTKDPELQVDALQGMSDFYEDQRDYSHSLEQLQQAVKISQQLQNPALQLNLLSRLGGVYHTLGDYPMARDLYNRLLVKARSVKASQIEALAWHSLALLAWSQGKPQETIAFSQKGIAIARQGNSLWLEGLANGVIASGYGEVGNDTKAMEAAQASLSIIRKLRITDDEVTALTLIGDLHLRFGRIEAAISAYQDALAVRPGKPSNGAYAGLGHAYAQLNQPETAIAFYKQAVNSIEDTRRHLKSDNPQLQQALLQATVDFGKVKRSDIYRQAADLLLRQNRIIEALQVLDLLKVEDLKDFLKDVKGNALTTKGLELLPQEEAILQTFNASPKQSLHTFLQNPTIQTQVQTLQHTATAQNLKLNAYQDLQTRIKKLGKHIALFYPLILDDRLELVVLTSDRPPIHKPVPISRSQLTSEVATFRQQLQARSPLVKQPAQQLYQHLIQPIESELRSAGVTTIVYAPDSILRYVPLAALHDGNQWLAQRYQINYLTALALTPLDSAPTETPHVLAGAVTREYTPIVNGQKYSFPALSQTQAEVEQIAKRYPNTQLLIDDRLNRQTIETDLSNSNIVHLATHAAFVSGSPDASFILLGDGSTLSLRDLNNLKLPHVSLFVLSACETALGEKLGNGIEIFGFGYQLQRNRVRASLASLWKVSDGGTQVLMNRFYAALKQGKTVAEAMQQAQEGFINHQVTPQEAQQIRSSARLHVEGSIPVDLTHPYYWAPFILIGNGL